jgi:DNA-binding CsgD family transcriptional regulator
MIDAAPSLRAAEGLSGAALATYLLSRGWNARPSRVEGVTILSKKVSEPDGEAEFILPVVPGFDDEHRRVADALRTIRVVEGRSEADIAEDVRRSESARVDGNLVERGGTSTRWAASTAAAEAETLTARQIAILEAIRKGSYNKQIARDLNMSEASVRVQVQHIMKKLGARNRTEVAGLAGILLAGKQSRT